MTNEKWLELRDDIMSKQTRFVGSRSHYSYGKLFDGTWVGLNTDISSMSELIAETQLQIEELQDLLSTFEQMETDNISYDGICFDRIDHRDEMDAIVFTFSTTDKTIGEKYEIEDEIEIEIEDEDE